MGHDAWLESLRRASGDPDALGRLLAGDLPTDALQHVGDSLLGVNELVDTDLVSVVDRLAGELRTRRWDGDDALQMPSTRSLVGRCRSCIRYQSNLTTSVKHSANKPAARTSSISRPGRCGSTP